MKTGQQEFDKLCNGNWDLLLKIFHKIGGKPEERKKQYVALAELAKTKTLSPRQAEGILGRCSYQISMIDNPKQEPFSNSLRVETRNLELPKEQANGKP